jgi:hypothetical protein
VWKEKKETLERKREGVYSKLLFNLSKPFIVEIKHCVLYPLSVSKPPPVVSPTNNWYQSPVRQKTEVFWDIPEFSKLSKTGFYHSTV